MQGMLESRQPDGAFEPLSAVPSGRRDQGSFSLHAATALAYSTQSAVSKRIGGARAP
jgi:hypothetical protein